MTIKVFVLCAVSLPCVNTLATTQITYEDAIDIAQRQNSEIKAQENTLESSRFLQKAARSNFLPNLTGSLSYDKNNLETIETGFKEDSKNFGAALNLRYNLFNGFSDSQNYNIAKYRVETQEALLTESKSSVSYDLKTSLGKYFYAKDSLEISKDIQRRRKDNLEMVELRFTSGRENKGSVLLSQAYLEQAKLDLIRAENSYKTGLASIRKVLNLSLDFDFEITGAPKTSKLPSETPNFDQIIEGTPTVKRYRASLETAKSNVITSRSGFFPTWDLNATLGKNGQEFFPDDTKRWSFGSTISWSLFNGGKDFYTVNSQALLRQAAQRDLDTQFLDLRRQLEETYASLVEAHYSVDVSLSFLNAAKVRAEIARSKYNNGLTNFEEWDRIENELISNQKDYIQKVRDLITAQATWDRVQGTGVIK